MLDARTIDIVKTSAPILAARGAEVTSRMYELMFAGNPEVKPLFNRNHQSSGGQSLALANAVYAYAANIDNLEVLLPAVDVITNKHVSLGIKPEHYPIVAKHLLQALKDVLDLSEEYLDAWGKAYWFLADLFIAREKELYQQGGWEGTRAFIIDRKVAESDIITSFYLRPKDGKKLPDFKPGQYITVNFAFPGGNMTSRNYSLSDCPNGQYYRISVKREERLKAHAPDGLVSGYLHHYMQEGMEVDVRAPAGHFVLDTKSERPLVLMSGGVGLTPMISMLNGSIAAHPQRDVYFFHAARNRRAHAFREHVLELAEKYPHLHPYFCYSDPECSETDCDLVGFITAEWLETKLPHKDYDFYFCGPKPFMQIIYHILKGWHVPESQIHYEFFGPAGALDAVEQAQPAAA